MVLLHNQNLPSRKRPPNSNAFISPILQTPKIPKSSSSSSSPVNINENVETENLNPIDKMASVLAEAGCTLINPLGPPCLPSDTNKLRHHLHRLFSSDSSLRSDFLSGFSSYVNSSPENLRRYGFYSCSLSLSLFTWKVKSGKRRRFISLFMLICCTCVRWCLFFNLNAEWKSRNYIHFLTS